MTEVTRYLNRLERMDANETHPGELFLQPYASMWYNNYRGTFLHKEIDGDFGATMRVMAAGKEEEVPKLPYSLSGLLAREPLGGTADSWRPGQENWVFVASGYQRFFSRPALPEDTAEKLKNDELSQVDLAALLNE